MKLMEPKFHISFLRQSIGQKYYFFELIFSPFGFLQNAHKRVTNVTTKIF